MASKKKNVHIIIQYSQYGEAMVECVFDDRQKAVDYVAELRQRLPGSEFRIVDREINRKVH